MIIQIDNNVNKQRLYLAAVVLHHGYTLLSHHRFENQNFNGFSVMKRRYTEINYVSNIQNALINTLQACLIKQLFVRIIRESIGLGWNTKTEFISFLTKLNEFCRKCEL